MIVGRRRRSDPQRSPRPRVSVFVAVVSLPFHLASIRALPENGASGLGNSAKACRAAHERYACAPRPVLPNGYKIVCSLDASEREQPRGPKAGSLKHRRAETTMSARIAA